MRGSGHTNFLIGMAAPNPEPENASRCLSSNGVALADHGQNGSDKFHNSYYYADLAYMGRKTRRAVQFCLFTCTAIGRVDGGPAWIASAPLSNVGLEDQTFHCVNFFPSVIW